MRLDNKIRVELKVLKRYLDDDAVIDWEDPKIYDYLLDDAVFLIKAIIAARMEDKPKNT